MSHLGHQIFSDPSGRRWKYIKIFFIFIFLLFAFVYGSLFSSILIDPHISYRQSFLNLLHHASQSIVQTKDIFKNPLGQKNIPQNKQAQEYRPKYIAFHVNWDDASFTSLKNNLNKLDMVIPEFLHLNKATGELTANDVTREKLAMDIMRQAETEIPVLPLINNFDPDSKNWDPSNLFKITSDSHLRQTVIRNLANYVRKNNYAGITIDFESLTSRNESGYVQFVQELSHEFKKENKLVYLAIPIADKLFDYAQAAPYVDSVILMAYDEHGALLGDQGPIASQQWFTESIHNFQTRLPQTPIIIALANYGYDWSENRVESYTTPNVINLMQFENQRLTFDSQSLNPSFTYTDKNNQTHTVWYLDGVTAYNQMQSSIAIKPAGFALWRLGSEDPTVWDYFNKKIKNIKPLPQMQSIPTENHVRFEGEGEVVQITKNTKPGLRQIEVNPQNYLVTNEKILEYPFGFTIKRSGGNNQKKVALTFDDGPNATFTPRILDVLQKYKVKATFFLIGENALKEPELVKRIVNEGHEIGNHTFFHPDIRYIPSERLVSEINATERLLESLTGRRPLFFRSPYTDDINPHSTDFLNALVYPTQMGYYNIRMEIDPKDWQNFTAEQIVQKTLEETAKGKGDIILLHDSGGDRTQTIEALPKLIEELQSQGYEIVPVADLMHTTRDEVMPTLNPQERFVSFIDTVAFMIIHFFYKFITIISFIGIVLTTIRFIFIISLASIKKHHEQRIKDSEQYKPKVSVIVPAYNEAKVITKTISSILKADYPNFDIIMIDDGSKDNTYAIVKETYQENPQVRAFTKPNTGKADTINFGLKQTDAEIVVILDGDTILMPAALKKLVRHFINPEVAAVAGNAKVGNRINLLTKLQAFEYITSQNLERRSLSLLNCIRVVPGAIGAWRRELLMELGGFRTDTLAEDADLTLNIIRQGHIVDHETGAIAYTESPDTLGNFIKQRFRWTFGTFQTLWKHHDIIFRPKYGALSLIALPDVLLSQLILPLISPILDFMMLAVLLQHIWLAQRYYNSYSVDTLQTTFVFYLTFLIIDYLTASLAFTFEHKEDKKLLFWLFIQRLIYRQIMYYIIFKSILTALKGSAVGWNKLERKATVQIG